MANYTFQWNLLKRVNDVLDIKITSLDETGATKVHTRKYRDWIGVCTGHIERIVAVIKSKFPGEDVTYEQLGNAKKILPYFRDRLTTGKLDYIAKPFYKIYTSACHEDVGFFFHKYKIGYFDATDYLVRIYIDFCTRYNTYSFYYRWYTIVNSNSLLLESFIMLPNQTHCPDWTIAAFDLETVALEGNHIPQGYFETDKIVTISVYKWNRRQIQSYLLYLLPDGMKPLKNYQNGYRDEKKQLNHADLLPDGIKPIKKYQNAYRDERKLLNDFHALIQDAQILTGYNINSFDFPCLFARLVWLDMGSILSHYSSRYVGQELITTFQNKLVLDLYAYFKTFSNYDLPSFKLDDVARVKLKGDSKLQIQSTGIWNYYKFDQLTQDVFESNDVVYCFQKLQPLNVKEPSKFGTFKMYLDYCLKDSELVYHLLEKENCLSFLVERANFTSLSVVEALHYGNSIYLLELFKTYGTRLGFFFNAHFFQNDCQDGSYQGALNYCVPESLYENVAVMDFASMYPSTLLSSNLCYGTCAILPINEAVPAGMICIPYRQHSNLDFQQERNVGETFFYPNVDSTRDTYVMVINPKAEAFLPRIVEHFIRLRRFHQNEWKNSDKDKNIKKICHFNSQQAIKILINSLYGIMGNRDSPLAYLAIAKSIVALAREQLLGSFHYIQQRRGFTVCYADTDSLMVCGWPTDHCDDVNAYLNLPNVQLSFEQRMKRLMVLSKKRYVYESAKGELVTKGFSKKINDLVKFMIHYVLKNVWESLFVIGDESDSRGWIIWADVLQRVNYMCRDPTRYSIYRKIKALDEYKSTTCPSVRYLQKYPDRQNEYINYTYTRADIAESEALKWVTDAEDCRWVNVEQLIMGPKATLMLLLKTAFWKRDNALYMGERVLNTLLWKKFVNAELLHFFKTRQKLIMLTLPGVHYKFSINEHILRRKTKSN